MTGQNAPSIRPTNNPPPMEVCINLNILEIWNSKDQRKPSKRLGRHFQGACLDTVTQQSVIGRRQARAYCKHQQRKFELKPSHTRFKFGDSTYPSLGSIQIRIPTPNESFLKIEMDVFEADVPMLLGLDIMDRDRLVPNNLLNELQAPYHGWLLPIIRKYGHLYQEWSSKHIPYTRPEL